MTRLENITKYMMGLLTALIVTTLYAPIVLTIFFSFYKTRKGQVKWDSFSYEPYTKLIFEKQILLGKHFFVNKNRLMDRLISMRTLQNIQPTPNLSTGC